MRLKCYIAATMSEAMAMVRRELGDDAIIVSTQRGADGQGVRVTAALEEVTTDEEVHQVLTGSHASPVVDHLREHLIYHGLPSRLIERMLASARHVDSEDPVMVCAGALDELFVFAPLPDRQAPRPFLLIGPPGAGKTIAVAKLAARSRLAHRSVGVITADTVRAGALEQLQAFTKILGVDLRKVRSGQALADVLYQGGGQHDLVFIDTPSLNPFVADDVAFLQELLAGVDVEPILVMAAGGDPIEAAEIGEIFASLGATRLLATRLDMTRRLGAVLSAAEAGQFMICDVSVNPQIVQGLCPISPLSMARLLVPQEEKGSQTGTIPAESAPRRSAPPTAPAPAAPPAGISATPAAVSVPMPMSVSAPASAAGAVSGVASGAPSGAPSGATPVASSGAPVSGWDGAVRKAGGAGRPASSSAAAVTAPLSPSRSSLPPVAAAPERSAPSRRGVSGRGAPPPEATPPAWHRGAGSSVEEFDHPPSVDDFFQMEDDAFVDPFPRDSEARPIFSFRDDDEDSGEPVVPRGRRDEGR